MSYSSAFNPPRYAQARAKRKCAKCSRTARMTSTLCPSCHFHQVRMMKAARQGVKDGGNSAA